jgi:hypothetical protein
MQFSVTQLLIGIVIAGIGVAFVKWTMVFANFSGNTVKTYGWFKIGGVAAVILGILVATGFGQNVISFLFSPFLHVFQSQQ